MCAEGVAAARSAPLVAAPIKGPLFDFLELDVDMAANRPAAAALQHLAQCVLQPPWLSKYERTSCASLWPLLRFKLGHNTSAAVVIASMMCVSFAAVGAAETAEIAGEV